MTKKKPVELGEQSGIYSVMLQKSGDVEKQLKESRDMNEEIEALKMIIRDL